MNLPFLWQNQEAFQPDHDKIHICKGKEDIEASPGNGQHKEASNISVSQLPSQNNGQVQTQLNGNFLKALCLKSIPLRGTELENTTSNKHALQAWLKW